MKLTTQETLLCRIKILEHGHRHPLVERDLSHLDQRPTTVEVKVTSSHSKSKAGAYRSELVRDREMLSWGSARFRMRIVCLLTSFDGKWEHENCGYWMRTNFILNYLLLLKHGYRICMIIVLNIVWVHRLIQDYLIYWWFSGFWPQIFFSTVLTCFKSSN